MAIKLEKGRYFCSYCGMEFSDPIACDSHKDSHELIYIALSKTDLNRLINFIYSGNEDYLTDSLVKNLSKYLKGNHK